ncbi:MAG TPA: hypothetical protein PLR83_12295 [Pyrinomonadaceae bacterium]|nr:hypothetical protein [Pyrinomonadaceae bacterium]
MEPALAGDRAVDLVGGKPPPLFILGEARSGKPDRTGLREAAKKRIPDRTGLGQAADLCQ